MSYLFLELKGNVVDLNLKIVDNESEAGKEKDAGDVEFTSTGNYCELGTEESPGAMTTIPGEILLSP